MQMSGGHLLAGDSLISSSPISSLIPNANSDISDFRNPYTSADDTNQCSISYSRTRHSSTLSILPAHPYATRFPDNFSHITWDQDRTRYIHKHLSHPYFSS